VSPSRPLMLACASFLATVQFGLAAEAQAFGRKDDRATVVQDLAYGEVLFYFFQEDYFSALTRLLAGRARSELPNHEEEAELLLGGLYLSYGQHRLAGEIFERVLEESVDSELHDRAWFFLAKIWYQRGYLAESEAALARINDELPDELEPERQMLHAHVLMDQGRFDDALVVLQAWRRPRDEWVGYTKFNIGVALVRLNRIEEGAEILEEVGRLDEDDPELSALRDKANVALGYAWLQAERPLEAKPPLQRVRLEGPFSNKAMLGVGWADAELENYQTALAPWIELRNRDLLDPAVQESLLAVPYAFTKLSADRQAADYYVDAIEAFNDEMARLDRSIVAIAEGKLVSEILNDEFSDASGWYWRMGELPDTPESRYLYELMAAHRFQEGLKNYRDLQYLQRNLDQWTESLSAFDDILDTKQRAYEQRLPAIDASMARMDLDEMAAERVEFESRLMTIERSEDVVALGTPTEQDLWRQLQGMESKLELLGDDPSAQEIREKQRFLKGLLVWDLRRDYRARLWQEQRSLRELDRDLKEIERLHHQVDSARTEWPEQFTSLTQRVADLTPRVQGLRDGVDATLLSQEIYLQGIAIDELQAQRERLNTYMVQARFALASIYDRASAQALDVAAADAPQLAEERP